jgi:hypothetical protein
VELGKVDQMELKLLVAKQQKVPRCITFRSYAEIKV